MKQNLKFKKGDFITQISYPNVFAIYGGTPYDPIEPGGEIDYSLTCYYNPSHFTQDSQGKWNSEVIFDYDLDGEDKCEYTINQSDMEYWRVCTVEEKKEALKILAEKKRLAWDDEKHILRHLAANEKFISDGEATARTRPASAGANPYYNHSNYQQTPVRPTIPARKTITLTVSATWKQKEPITVMDKVRRELVLAQCDKLKYAFNSYSSNNVVIYPQNGTQVPRRSFGADAMMCGYCGWPMMGGMWDGEYWGDE